MAGTRMLAGIEIGEVRHAEVGTVVDFVMHSRAQIFPMLDASVLPPDLAAFSAVYLQDGGGRFLVARQAGEVVASIAYLPYDQRFAQLDYDGRNVVEIIRLFVLPRCRGIGLAHALYRALAAQAQCAGVQVLYLHTHPFLPGAIEFWRRQGFAIVDVEDDPVWRTTHMERALGVAEA